MLLELRFYKPHKMQLKFWHTNFDSHYRLSIIYIYRLPCRSHQSNSLPRKNFIIHYPQMVFVHNEGKKKLMG